MSELESLVVQLELLVVQGVLSCARCSCASSSFSCARCSMFMCELELGVQGVHESLCTIAIWVCSIFFSFPLL